MTRLTNAHSKKMRNHHAALALHIAKYNLCRYHSTIRATPAMAAGVTTKIWDIERRLDAALAEST